MSISEVSVKRPVAMCMIVMIIVVLGLYSLTMLPMDLYPNITLPMILVQTTYSGVSPTEMENMVTKPLEGAAATVSGIKNIQSTSSQGSSMIIAEFNQGVDIDVAAMEMREKIDLYGSALPDGADDPMIIKMDPSMIPIGNFSVSVEGYDLEQAKTFVENEIVSQLEGLTGVGQVSVGGGLDREIQVEVDPAKLLGYQLSFGNITTALQGDNVNLPGGDVQSGGKTISLRSIGEFTNMEDIESLPVMLPTGGTIYLRDVAEVKDTYKTQESYSRLNNADCVSLSIQKQSGSNTVQVMDLVNEKLEQIRKDNPSAQIQVIFDQSDLVKQMVNTVAENAVIGALLAGIILFLFLQSFKTTIVLAVSIPTSIVATFAAMYFAGVTLNIVSLGGLALGVGMLVDNSIVVLENIYKCKARGMPARTAAIKGAAQVAGAITASTLTTVVVFLPVVFTQDITSIIFREMALTIAFSQICSLLITLMIVPLLSSKLLVSQEHKVKSKFELWEEKVFAPFNRFMDAFHNGYEKLVRMALNHRKRVAAITLLLFVGSVCLLPFIGMEFMPGMDGGQFTIDVTMPKGSDLDEADRATRQVETIASGYDEVEYVFSNVSGDSAQVMVTLHEGERADEVSEAMRQEVVGKIAGAEISFSSSSSVMSGGSPINVTITGDDYDQAEIIADQILLEMQSIEGVRDAKSSVEDTKPEMRVYVDRERAARYGLTTQTTAAAIRGAISGQVAGQFKDSGEEYDIRVQFPESYVGTVEAVQNIKLTTPTGAFVTIGDVADISMDKGPLSLSRQNQKNAVSISASLYGRDVASVNQDIQQIVDNMSIPDGYDVSLGGDYESMLDSFSGLGMAMILSILLVYMVMAAQFESFLQPFIIMFSIPLSFIGVFLMLFISRNTLNVTSMIGIIMLCGIVVNNAIVLLDHVNQNKEERMAQGATIKDVLAEAGRDRLRPILMTTLTSILGYLPSIISTAQGSEMMKPLAWTLTGGLSVSTLLTLVFVPVVYSVLEEKVQKHNRKKLEKQQTGVSVMEDDPGTDVFGI